MKSLPPILRVACVSLCLLAAALAQESSPAKSTSGLDLSENIDPCTDFYAYACSKWQAQSPVPPDQPGWGRFDELARASDSIVRLILEKYSSDNAGRSPDEQKIGDYYEACTDESAIAQAGTQPLREALAAIGAVKSKDELALLLAQLHRRGINAFFLLSPRPDFHDATQVIAEVKPAGTAVPDRNFYLRRDRQAAALRKRYREHVQSMFELLGDSRTQAIATARTVLDIETGLAQAMPDHSVRGGTGITYRKMPAHELAALTPNFTWNAYLKQLGLANDSSLSVADASFFAQMDRLLQSASLPDLQTYLRWQTLHASAEMLPSPFVEENFNFFDKTLSGTKALPPRWKQCERLTTSALGDAVGRKYVTLAFSSESKARVERMVEDLRSALADDVATLPWMAAETRQQAQQKLAAITSRIGYPDQWRDYSGLEVRRGDALGNFWRAREFEFQRELNTIGKPVNKNDWPDPPTTADAAYNDQQNSITFPAGILQPPFFDSTASDAQNLGAIGALIGHELTHGFDRQGSRFDAEGNVRNWWTDADRTAFQQRAQCSANQYSGYQVVGRLKVDGQLTLDEDIADNGGVRLAYAALQKILADKPLSQDALTPQQRFFLGWANLWCQNRTETYSRELAAEDSHPPGKWRVNGVVSNMPEFRSAFACKTGQAMVSANACRVW